MSGKAERKAFASFDAFPGFDHKSEQHFESEFNLQPLEAFPQSPDNHFGFAYSDEQGDLRGFSADASICSVSSLSLSESSSVSKHRKKKSTKSRRRSDRSVRSKRSACSRKTIDDRSIEFDKNHPFHSSNSGHNFDIDFLSEREPDDIQSDEELDEELLSLKRQELARKLMKVEAGLVKTTSQASSRAPSLQTSKKPLQGNRPIKADNGWDTVP